MKIEFNNVKKEYLETKNSLNFSIPENKISVLYGENGTGKSTIALLASTFLKPSEGFIIFDDIKFDSNKTKKKLLRNIRTKIKIVFQDIDLQIFKQTIEQEIIFSYQSYLKKNNIKGEDKINFLEDKINFIFQKINFPKEYRKKSPHQLSMGEKRKLIVSCLLFSDTEVLILDEPTAGLDAKTKKNFINFIKEINNEYKTTILIISHDYKIINSFDKNFYIKDLFN